MKKLVRIFAVLAVAATALAGRPAAADPGVEKSIKTLITSVRYSKDTLALGQLDGETQAKFLLGDYWEKGTEQQRAQFIRDFHALFAALAFPQIRANFEHLETTLYDPAKVDGNRAESHSTIVILHPLKKQEIKVKYDLSRHKSGWKIVDVTVLGTPRPSSFLNDIRNDQVQPLLKQGGWDRLLGAMTDRLAQIETAKKAAPKK